MQLQLADSSVCRPEGIAEDIPVKVRECFVPVDFAVLDMDIEKETPLILRRPFLSTTNTNIDVAVGEIRLHINGQEKFNFRPWKEQCSMIKIKYGPNPQGIKELKVTPQKNDNLIMFMKDFKAEELPLQHHQKKQVERQGSTANPQRPRKSKKAPTTPAKPKKIKKVWRVKNVESSASGCHIIEVNEKEKSPVHRTQNDGSSPQGNPVVISYLFSIICILDFCLTFEFLPSAYLNFATTLRIFQNIRKIKLNS